MIVFYSLFVGILLGTCQAISRSHSKMEDMSVVYVPIPDTVYVTNDTLAIEDMFGLYHYNPEDYVTFIGLDDIALFSSAVSITEERIAVGSNGYNIFEGIVHIYDHQSACHWTLQSYIHSPLGDNAGFGNAVALERDRVIVGSNAWEGYTGKAFIYSLYQDVFWKLEAQLDSPLSYAQGFGYDVSLSGNWAMVTTGVNNVYVYENAEYGWTLQADLQPPLPYIKFGHSASINGDYIVIGAEAWQNSTGRVFIYHLDNHTWSLNYTLESVTGQNSYFGHSVDIWNDTIVVGAKGFQSLMYHSQGQQTNNNPGWVYVYQKHEKNSWLMYQAIQSPLGNNSYFGADVSVHENSFIVGADGFPNAEITGAAFSYRRDSRDAPYELESAYPSVAGSKGHFGWATDIVNTFVAVGAYGYDDLRGGMFLACREGIPSPPPTSQPSSRPTSQPSPVLAPALINSRDDGIVINKTKWPWGILVAMLIGVCLMACIIGLCIYCCCLFCCFPIVVDKKKKKKKKKKDGEDEEGDSTYTIHGPGGLIDEDGTVYGPEFLTTGSSAVTESYEDDDSDVYEETTTTIKKTVSKKGGKKGKREKESSYKVYGYQGPLEGDTATEPLTESQRSERESNKNSGVSSGSSSSVVSTTTESVNSNHTVVSREDSDVVAAFKLSKQQQGADRVFTRPKNTTSSSEAHHETHVTTSTQEVLEEVADIYEPKVLKDNFFGNSGVSPDEYDLRRQQQMERSQQISQQYSQQQYHYQQQQMQQQQHYYAQSPHYPHQQQQPYPHQQYQQSAMFISPAESMSESGSIHSGSVRSDSSVGDAKARLKAYKAKIREVNSANIAANQNFASYKARMEAEERQREEENARIRAQLEQTRLMAEAAEATRAAEAAKHAEVEKYRAQIEHARQLAAEQEAAQKRATASLLKAKAEEEARARFAQFKAQREAEASQHAAEEAARLQAEEEAANKAAREAAVEVQRAREADEAQRQADKQRLKDEARIRAEEKAKARFLSFKAKAEAEAANGSGGGSSNKAPADDASNQAAVAAARAKLDAINAVLREKPVEQPAPEPEVIVKNEYVVNETHNETVTNTRTVINSEMRQKSITLEFAADDMV